MRKIEQLELAFENCETMTFIASDVNSLDITGISRGIQYVGANGVVEYISCQLFALMLPPIANRQYVPFGVEEIGVTTTFDRLCRSRDIVSVCVVYEDGEREEILVPWRDDGKFGIENMYQISQLTSDGALFIYIAKHKPEPSVEF